MQPYIGEIRMFAGTFAPVGWVPCDGRLLPISENDALFIVLGTMYGGDGQETFGVPNLMGRAPVHKGQGPGISQNYQMGEMAGVESVTLTVNQIPVHNHAMLATSSIGNLPTPQSNLLGKLTNVDLYSGDSTDTALNSVAINPAGGSQPHDNMQPYLAITYIMSLFGIFPHQT
jgi:microcystin-dependent protein